jgi:hypothetical protein
MRGRLPAAKRSGRVKYIVTEKGVPSTITKKDEKERGTERKTCLLLERKEREEKEGQKSS